MKRGTAKDPRRKKNRKVMNSNMIAGNQNRKKYTKSRVLVNENKYSDKDPTIEYYDYDCIEEDGSSRAYIFTLSNETYQAEKNIITESGRDYDRVMIDMFAEYEGWKDLKEYFDDNFIPYEYEEIVLSKEERYERQRSQFGEHRCVYILSCSRKLEDPTLNEYEYDRLYEMLKQPGIAWDIPFGWEEDDFKFLRVRTRYYYLNDIDVLGKSEDGVHYLFENGHWQKDVSCKIMDRLCGYDPYDDTPYGFGNSSVLFTIDEISKKEAYEYLNKTEE